MVAVIIRPNLSRLRHLSLELSDVMEKFRHDLISRLRYAAYKTS